MSAQTDSWKMTLPLLGALVLFAACSGFWYWLMSQAQSSFDTQTVHTNAKTRLACAEATWGGYPFQVRLDCTSPELLLNFGRTRVASKRFTAFARVYSPWNILVTLEGPTIINDSRQAAPVEVDYTTGDITVHVASQRSFEATGQVSLVTIKQNDAQLMDAKDVVLKGDFAAGQPNNLTIDLNATGVSLVGGDNDVIVLDQIAGILKAANVPEDRAVDFADWLKAAAATQTQFEVESFKAAMGNTELTGQGGFQIGTDGYLTGKLKTRLSKLDELLNQLQERRILSSKNAKAAGSLLGLFDRGQGLQADVHLKQGEVFWGPLKLGRHAPLF